MAPRYSTSSGGPAGRLLGMFRFSIKTKLSAVIAFLVLGFALFNVLYYPRQEERRFREQAELSARQVAEAASYALAPAMDGEHPEEIARVLRGIQRIPTFRFSMVVDPRGRILDASPATPEWVKVHARPSAAGAYIHSHGTTMLAIAPVAAEYPADDQHGTLVLGFSTEEIRRLGSDHRNRGIWVGAAGLAASPGRNRHGFPLRHPPGGLPHHGGGQERPPGDRSATRRLHGFRERRAAARQVGETRGRPGLHGPDHRQQRQHAR